MSCPRPIPRRRAYAETKNSSWSLFFGEAPYRVPLQWLQGERSRLPDPNRNRRNKRMKKLSVVVAGTGQIRDVEIQTGTTAGDILHQLNLPDYLLSKGPNEPFFAAAESVYDKVRDGEKIFASDRKVG